MKKQKSIFSCNKKKAAAASIATAAMLIPVGMAAVGEGAGGSSLITSVLLTVLAVIFLMLDFSFGKVLSLLLYLILPAAALVALENYTHVIADLSPMILMLNLLFFYLLYGVCTFLFGSVRWGFLAATLVPMFFGLANYFVVNFRGTPIVPWDLLSLGTAVSVADNYSFTLPWKQCFVVQAFVWIILIAGKSSVRFTKKKVRLILGILSILIFGVYISSIQKSAVQSFWGMDTTLFTLNVLYRNNGIAAAFLGNLRFLNLEEPDGYSVEAVQEIAEAAEASAEENPDDGSGSAVSAGASTVGDADVTQYPNVIVIMDEAFSDLSVWGEFATSEEVMPFFKMLQKQGIGGELYVSVKGGNTANTEFEFLTGDTMGFLPAGSVPYQQYINGEMPSIVSYLKSLGFSTTAIHPYNRSGWDRDEVYEYFGFDEFLDTTAFDNPHRMRGYVSDRAAFDKIIEQYELKGEDERLFVFEVTMQNHGGYSKETPDFESYLTLPEVTDKTTSVLATEKYLTLMNETDRALQDLILYFQEQKEPVVVLMFGDHQPSDYITNVVRRICGVGEAQTLEEVQQGYRVPFMIWSNCGLEQTYYDGISTNYLGGILMEAAGIPLTGYQTYLSELMEAFPVINGNVYRDSEGTFHSYEEEEELLNDYKILQYNHLVDDGKRVNSFFGIE